jgi:uncharacterized OB-fold protein
MGTETAPTTATEDRPRRPLPRPSPLTQPFWNACAEGRLIYQRGVDDPRPIFPPRNFSPHDLSTDLVWADSSGAGRIYSFTVVWRPPTPAFESPFVVAIVELEEGYTMLSNVVDCDVHDVQIGMKVHAIFRAVDGFTLPFFTPVPAGDSD